MMQQITHILHENQLIAIIIPNTYEEHGVHFFTPNDLSQQLAYMRHPAGKQIPPHVHNPLAREVLYTQEVLIIRKGRLRVDFYDNGKNYLESRILDAGDVILLVTGGHGFEALEEMEIIEVKQGPYTGDADKIRIPSINRDELKIKEL